MSQSQAEALIRRGVELHRKGDLGGAESLYRKALEHSADNPDALHLLGMIAFQHGQHARARELISLACRGNPSQALFFFNLGRVDQDGGNLDSAIQAFTTATTLSPDFAEALLHLCQCLLAKGHWREAIPQLARARRLQPADPAIPIAMATAYQQLNRQEEAERALADALQLNPAHGPAWFERGRVLIRLERWGEAIAALRKAAALLPDDPDVHCQLGIALDGDFQRENALLSFRAAIAIAPAHRRSRFAEARLLEERGDHDAARKLLAALETEFPDSIAAFLKASMLSVIPPSAAAMADERQRMSDDLARLRESKYRLTDPLGDGFRAPFFLAYHDANPKSLMTEIAATLRQACPDLGFVAPHCLDWKPPSERRIRVGFVSRYLHEHTIGHLMSGVITGIDRQRFELHCIRFSPPRDSVSHVIAENCEHHHVVPGSREGRDGIANLGLDVLVYLDLGMDPFTYLCAFSRLAPIQCVAWGHPITSGLQTIDYFLTSTGQEGDAPETRYTEKPVLLNAPLYYYQRPVCVGDGGALPDSLADVAAMPLYFCAQTPFKLHPDFDAILAKILARDRRGIVVMVEADQPNWTSLLSRRFAASIPEAAERIRFIPRLARNEYLRLLAAVPVVLDTRPFGGGLTTLDTLAVGTPIVTWPGDAMASRFTADCYARMGIAGCTAKSEDDYVEIACRIAGDPTLRSSLSARISAANAVLYSNPAPIRALEECLTQIVKSHQ
jgi:predicted O-linked N-acetylglucosamine transferase (SPINDLY family)